MKITLRTAYNYEQVIERETPCTAEELVRELKGDFPYQILLCRKDGRPESLKTLLDHDCTVDLSGHHPAVKQR